MILLIPPFLFSLISLYCLLLRIEKLEKDVRQLKAHAGRPVLECKELR